MADVRADGIAVYVYCWKGKTLSFLQIQRSAYTGEYQRSWQIVYGGIKKKETAVQAALREMREEIGLKPKSMHQVEYLEQFYFRPHDYVLVMPVFAAEVAADAKIKLNKEHDDFRWVKASDIARKFMWRTQREALGIITAELTTPGLAAHLLKIDLKAEK